LAGNRDFRTPWKRADWDRKKAIDRLLPAAETLGKRTWDAYDREDYLARNLDEVRRFSEELHATEVAQDDGQPRDYDGIESRLYQLSRVRSWRWRGRGRMYGDGLTRSDVVHERDAFKDQLDVFVAASGADIAACLQADLWPVVDAYDALKERTGELDFLDLLLKTRDLLRGEQPVRHQLQERFTHIFGTNFKILTHYKRRYCCCWRAVTPWNRIGAVWFLRLVNSLS